MKEKVGDSGVASSRLRALVLVLVVVVVVAVVVAVVARPSLSATHVPETNIKVRMRSGVFAYVRSNAIDEDGEEARVGVSRLAVGEDDLESVCEEVPADAGREPTGGECVGYWSLISMVCFPSVAIMGCLRDSGLTRLNWNFPSPAVSPRDVLRDCGRGFHRAVAMLPSSWRAENSYPPTFV